MVDRLLQDENKNLSRWLSNRINAKAEVRAMAHDVGMKRAYARLKSYNAARQRIETQYQFDAQNGKRASAMRFVAKKLLEDLQQIFAETA